MAISPMQSMFNKVVRHIRRQGKAALRTEPGLFSPACSYRGDGGTECAVGCLIPNKLYRPNMEGNSVMGLLSNFPKLTAHLNRLYGADGSGYYGGNRVNALLRRLQSAHDNIPNYGMQDFEDKIKGLAVQFGLTVPKVKKPRSKQHISINKAYRQGDGWYVAVRASKGAYRAEYVHSDGSLHPTTRLGRDWPGYFKSRAEARKARALARSLGNI